MTASCLSPYDSLILSLCYMRYVIVLPYRHAIPLFSIWYSLYLFLTLSSFIVLCAAFGNCALPHSFLYLYRYLEWVSSPLSIYDLHISLSALLSQGLRTEDLLRTNKGLGASILNEK